MEQSSAGGTGWLIDWFRHCRELIVPTDYLTRPYFDQWATTLAAQMVDEGYLTLEEIKAGASAFIRNPAIPPKPPRLHAPTSQTRRATLPQIDFSPRFALGDVVRCPIATWTGHTRLPGYVRGHAGVIHARHGGHLLPDASTRGEKRAEPL